MAHEQDFYKPRELTMADLNQAPAEAIPVLRSMSRAELLDGLAIGETEPYDNPELRKILKEMQPGKITGVGEVRVETWDKLQSRNWVVPLFTDEGTGIEVVFNNAAGGVGWRLARNHPMIQKCLQLGRVLNEDSIKNKSRLTLPPSVLAEYTDKSHDIGRTAEYFRKLMEWLVKQDDITIGPSSAGTDNKYLSDKVFYGFRIGIERVKADKNIFLEIGSNTGLRVVSMRISDAPEFLKTGVVELEQTIEALNCMPSTV